MRFHRGAAALVAAMTIGSSGCTRRSEQDTATIPVDSAGSRIVTTTRTGMEELPTWHLVPQLTLGGEGSDSGREFYRMSDARLLSSGTIAVVNSGTAEVRFFDRSGRLIATVGREGDGPEEFREPVRVEQVDGDTIVVLDRELRRLTVLAPDLRYVRTERLEGDLATVGLVGGVGNGLVVIENTAVQAPPGSAVTTNTTTLLLYDLRGRRVGRLGVCPSRRWKRLSAGMIMRPQFDALTTFTTSGGGVWIGTALHDQVVLVDRLGRSVLIGRWQGADRSVTSADRRRWRDEMLSWPRTAQEKAMAQAQVDGAVFASEMPAYRRVVPSGDGGVWVQQYTPFETDSLDWLVIDASGRVRARVRTASELRVFEVRNGEAVGRLPDTLGAEQLVLANIRR